MQALRPVRSILGLAAAAAVVATSAAHAGAPGAGSLVPPSQARLVRAEVHLVPNARKSPHLLLMTLGGPPYCLQLALLARALDASRLCLDYGPNRYEGVGEREARKEDWGDPAYAEWLAELAGLLGRRVVGYVTQMQHAHALWNRGREVLALAGVGSGRRPFAPTQVLFRPGQAPPAGSYCS